MRTLMLALFLPLLAACTSAEDAALHATGTVEATEIDIAALGAGRVLEMRVDEGDTVQAGDTIAVLTRSELPSELELARARVEAARSRAQQVERGPRQQEIATARAQLRAAEAELTAAERELERVRRLVRDSLAAPRELDRAESAVALARGRRETASETLALLNAGSRPEERTGARAELQAAEAAYNQVRAAAGELVVVSSARGVVQLQNFEPGEVVLAGTPLVTLINPSDLWVRIYVRQESLASIKLGDELNVTADALPGQTFRGRIIEIAPRAEFIPRVALTEKERADLVFAVRLRLPPGSPLRPGMAVDASIPQIR